MKRPGRGKLALGAGLGEEVKQWTDVLHARPLFTDHPQPTWTHTVYVSGPGRIAVDAYSVAGAPHTLGLDYPDWAQLVIRFFGLTAGRR